MEIFLAILMVLGIFIAIPAIIAFIYIGVVSGLFTVIGHNMRRKIAAPRRRAVKRTEEAVLKKVI